ncbi:hypothetical protein ACROYT_G025911 [Oculina patagonica]
MTMSSYLIMSGCAITLALTGADLSEIIEHVGWARRHTALYYLQLAKVLNHDDASGRLAMPSAENVVTPWKSYLSKRYCKLSLITSVIIGDYIDGGITSVIASAITSKIISTTNKATVGPKFCLSLTSVVLKFLEVDRRVPLKLVDEASLPQQVSALPS